jgi:hypothetical protein
MIKILFEEYHLDLTYLIFKEINNLGIDFEEASLLNSLAYYHRDEKSFNFSKFIKKNNANKANADKTLNSLINKQLINFELVTDLNGRSREILNFNGFYSKLSQIINNKQNNSYDPKSIKLLLEQLTQYQNRDLTPTELVIFESLTKTYSYPVMWEAIETLHQQGSLQIYAVKELLEQKSNNNLDADQINQIKKSANKLRNS